MVYFKQVEHSQRQQAELRAQLSEASEQAKTELAELRSKFQEADEKRDSAFEHSKELDDQITSLKVCAHRRIPLSGLFRVTNLGVHWLLQQNSGIEDYP